MAERLLKLKQFIRHLATTDPARSGNDLNDYEWSVLASIVTILAPFMSAQKLLEGQNCVTISLVHVIVKNLRKELERILENRAQQSE